MHCPAGPPPPDPCLQLFNSLRVVEILSLLLLSLKCLQVCCAFLEDIQLLGVCYIRDQV